MSGISDKAIKANYAENKYRYNGGNELQNKEFSDGSGLEEYDATARLYDPQIGRFQQLDPLADLNEGYSPYSFANDNPILLNDPLGLKSDTQTLPAVVVKPPPPAPRSTVSVGLADTKGDAPDVAASNGPAPSHAPAPIQSDEQRQGWAKLDELVGYNPLDFQYQQEHFVVREPTFFERFFDNSDNGRLLGYNWQNNPVYQRTYGGSISPAITGVGAAGSASALLKTLQLVAKPRTVTAALELAERILGPGYTEIAPGVFRSADKLKQFRMTLSDLNGVGFKGIPHVHIEIFDPGNLSKAVSNYHIPLIDP